MFKMTACSLAVADPEMNIIYYKVTFEKLVDNHNKILHSEYLRILRRNRDNE